MSSTSSAAPAPLLLRIAALLIVAFLMAPGSAARAQENTVMIGPFSAAGDWSIEESAIRGRGTIESPWGSKIAITASYDDAAGRGTFQGKFTHPLLGNINVARGTVTREGLEFEQRIRLPAGTATFDFRLTPDELTGSGEATLKLGPVSLGRDIGLRFADGRIVATSSVAVRLPGIAAPAKLNLAFEALDVTAAGEVTVKLGSYSFDAQVTISMAGDVVVAASQAVNVPGIGSTQFTINYNGKKIAASATRSISLGDFLFEEVAIGLDSSGKVLLSHDKSLDLPGIGSTSMHLSYANGTLSATGSRTISLGDFSFSSVAIAINSAGNLSLSKRQALTIPGIGSTQLNLAYANGSLTASGSRSITLGGYSFSNVAIALDASGNVSVVKQQSVSIPGIGSTQVELAYSDGAIYASATRDVSLAGHIFSNAAVLINASGVSVGAQQSVDLPAIGSTEMALTFANGAVFASATRTVSLGEFAFSNTAIRLDADGLTMNKQQSLNLPGLGQTDMTLAYANGVVSATGSRTVNLGEFAFSGVGISLDSSGNVSAAKEQSLNLPGLGSTAMTIAYSNGNVSASGSRTVSLGDIAFSNVAISLDSAGNVSAVKQQSVSIPGIGSVQMSLSLVSGVLSASGAKTIQLGGYAFDNTSIGLTSVGGITASKQANLDIPGIGSATMTLGYANGALSATGRKTISLGNLAFNNATITLSNSGVSVNEQANLEIPGIGTAAMTLAYANGVLSASGTKNISLGNFAFNDAAITVSSNGTVTVADQANLGIPGIGNVAMTLSYANSVLKATGTASITVHVLGRDVNFGSAAVSLSSAGQVSVSASKSVLGYTVTISYENGSIHVHY